MHSPQDKHRQVIAAQLTIAAMQNFQAQPDERFILDRVPFVMQAYEAIYDRLGELEQAGTETALS